MRMRLDHAVVVILLLCWSAPLAAQSVRGRVTDAATGQGVAGVRVELLSANGNRISEGVSGTDGSFQVLARAAGQHLVRSSHIAYRTATSQPFLIQAQEQVVVDVKLSTTAIQLDPLTITARRVDPRRDPTHEGFYARQLLLPSLGNRRAITRWDHEMANARDARDILTWVVPPRRQLGGEAGCLIVWWNGSPVMFAEEAANWLQTPTGLLEGVEYYRYITDAPPSMRDVPPYLIGCLQHSVLALWSRTGYFPEPPPEPFQPPRRRVHVAAAMYHLSGRDAPDTGVGLEAAVHWPIVYGVAIGLHVRRSAHHLSAETTSAMMQRLGPATYALPQGERPLTLWVLGLEPRVILPELAGLWPVASLRLQAAQRRFTLTASSSSRHDVPITSNGFSAGATLGVEKLLWQRFALHVAIGHDRLFFHAYDALERRWNPTGADWGGTSLRVGFGYALER